MRERRIILASASPRRRMLLEAIGFRVDVRPTRVVEARAPLEPPVEMVQRLAREKAAALPDAPDDVPVVAADTAVVLPERLEDVILGKPRDEHEAREMLRRLSGNEHQVMTGYCVRLDGEERVGVVRTQVWFRSLSDEEIHAYVASGEPLDKAGAYGIQGGGGALVDRISGSYSNVVGLPVAEVLWDLEELKRCR